VSGIRARLGRGARRLFGPSSFRKLASWPVVVVVACVAVVVVLGVRAEHRRDPVDDSVGDVPRVGPVDGERVAAYLGQARDELAALPADEQTWALVGFTAYQKPAGLTPLLAGYRVDRVLARVPLPGVQTQLVTLVVHTLSVDVPTGMQRVAAAKEKDATDAVDAGTAALDRREASAYRQLCGCLYAAVVRADGASLRALAGRTGVRIIDPAPEVTRLDRATFVPLLPEQSETVGPPGNTTTASPTPSAG
jgi:hypothetical protein